MMSVAEERGAVVKRGEGGPNALRVLVLETRGDLSETAGGRRNGVLKGVRAAVATTRTGAMRVLSFGGGGASLRIVGSLGGARACLTAGG